eukprot:CAMPEP_0170457434 /NCGR_PEP_ID=MMETSP0123-20130129/4723_1 /TAXON_ID=182087 /ORGANISM="Favella ehrenbergii, Strain Fehren 1" /LENGTH=90 /DNA_ID=CAMNT_0010721217 /DNA_START=326 /DNA_END=598 /DNA_ORIENTATION=-
MNWAAYNGRGQGASDEDDEPMLEVADNYMRTPRAAIFNRKRRVSDEKVELDYARLDREKVEASVVALEATFSTWLASERDKQNAFLKKKS